MADHLRRAQNSKAHYLSKDSQNEFITLLADAVLKKIRHNVQTAPYYSVLMDCTPDISHKEQLSLMIRYVSTNENKVEVNESFLEFVTVENTTGEGLTNMLLDGLAEHNIEIEHCKGQCYDNDANMKGVHGGTSLCSVPPNPLLKPRLSLVY